MTSLADLHGKDHEKETRQMKASFEINALVSNISQSNFRFNTNTSVIWQRGNLFPSAKKEFVIRMKKRNPNMVCQWINKVNPRELKALPELIVNSPVEYLLVLDTSANKPTLYTLYITPKHCSAF